MKHGKGIRHLDLVGSTGKLSENKNKAVVRNHSGCMEDVMKRFLMTDGSLGLWPFTTFRRPWSSSARSASRRWELARDGWMRCLALPSSPALLGVIGRAVVATVWSCYGASFRYRPCGGGCGVEEAGR